MHSSDVEGEHTSSLGEGGATAEQCLSGIRMEGKVKSLPGFWDQSTQGWLIAWPATQAQHAVPRCDDEPDRMHHDSTLGTAGVRIRYPMLAGIREVGRRHRPTRPLDTTQVLFLDCGWDWDVFRNPSPRHPTTHHAYTAPNGHEVRSGIDGLVGLWPLSTLECVGHQQLANAKFNRQPHTQDMVGGREGCPYPRCIPSKALERRD